MANGFKEFIAELQAMSREAAKDVRATAHETYFGQPEHAQEIGTPMNPLPREVYEQKHDIEPQNDGPEMQME